MRALRIFILILLTIAEIVTVIGAILAFNLKKCNMVTKCQLKTLPFTLILNKITKQKLSIT